jgi:flavin-dependent thymidylate synthase
VNEGGTHEGGNLQTLCKTCHKVKSASEKAKGKSAFPPRYTKLVSRSDDGVEDVYDITVEGHHNFLANGLVVHNCVGLVWNEVSRRYVDSEPEFFLPDVWRARAENVKQGSADEPAPHQGALQGLARLHLERSLDLYSQMLENGVAPEQARMVLPLNVMTEWVWTGSLVAWARVCRLRLDPHAQVEVQEVAKHFDNLLRPAFPVSWPALMGESQ